MIRVHEDHHFFRYSAYIFLTGSNAISWVPAASLRISFPSYTEKFVVLLSAFKKSLSFCVSPQAIFVAPTLPKESLSLSAVNAPEKLLQPVFPFTLRFCGSKESVGIVPPLEGEYIDWPMEYNCQALSESVVSVFESLFELLQDARTTAKRKRPRAAEFFMMESFR
jgi:hypothetical protein